MNPFSISDSLSDAVLSILESKALHVWLDDLRPIRPGYNALATTANEAIKLLKTGRVESISLDHDLGPPEAGTGYDVAQWIEEAAYHGKLKRLSWNIHSANPVGVNNMRQALQSADRFWSR
jgi:hypothetical protein